MATKSTINRPKILIVDDEPKNLLSYERILQALNMDIQKVLSGHQALIVAQQHDFFLILMDVQMPDMDGFETASLILEHPNTQHIPLIFITAFAKDEVFKFKGYKSGAVDYLTKPINDEILKGKIAVFLQLWQERQMVLAKNHELQQLNLQLLKTTKALEKAKAVAELATKSKSDFLSNMSHELRSPLNAILVLSRVLSEKTDGQLTARDIRSATIIHQSGKQLLELINDILDLAKVEAGMLAIDMQTFSLQRLLQLLLAQLAPLAEEKGLALLLDIAADIPDKVQSDQLRLGQILRNLVSNAIKFTRDGQVTIAARSLSDTHLCISVSDTGIGIKPENLDSIFEAFKQEEVSTTRRFGGTGLGLSISLSLVKLLGGEFHISSELGKGSCFSIDLPMVLDRRQAGVNMPGESSVAMNEVFEAADLSRLVQPQTNTARSTHTAAVMPDSRISGDYQQLKDKTILLVEDDMRNAFALMAALEGLGAKVDVAVNGQIALDKLENACHPDIVLMDIMMPDMDGYEAIEKIRVKSKRPALPIIAVTAKGQDLEEKCLALGVNDFLTKPVDVDQLFAKMTELIRVQNH